VAVGLAPLKSDAFLWYADFTQLYLYTSVTHTSERCDNCWEECW